jgi:hypothetical protein
MYSGHASFEPHIVAAANHMSTPRGIHVPAAPASDSAAATLIDNFGMSQDCLRMTLTDFDFECEVLAQLFR